MLMRITGRPEINAAFEQTDVVLVIGANYVVNPLARTDPYPLFSADNTLMLFADGQKGVLDLIAL